MLAPQVQIGAMQVDVSTLLLERRVALLGSTPLGSVAIHLSGPDMGRFLSHPLFQQAASTAVQVRSKSTAAVSSRRRHGRQELECVGAR
jgi:hypothetical protein